MTFASIMGNLYAVEFASLQYTSSSWVLYKTIALLSGRMTARVCLPFCTQPRSVHWQVHVQSQLVTQQQVQQATYLRTVSCHISGTSAGWRTQHISKCS